MPILEFQHVSKVYNHTTRALDDLSFSVKEGELLSIIGPSGAGKSTILRCINRLIDATEGKIFYDGEDIMHVNKKQLRQVRTKTGMIFQHYNLVDRLSVMENVLHGRLGQKFTFSGMIGHYSEAEKEQGGDYVAQDQEFVLMHGDCLEMNGFISHLKLPHYVTFQSKLDAVRKTRRKQSNGTD